MLIDLQQVQGELLQQVQAEESRILGDVRRKLEDHTTAALASVLVAIDRLEQATVHTKSAADAAALEDLRDIRSRLIRVKERTHVMVFSTDATDDKND